jgi:hypothetical protein
MKFPFLSIFSLKFLFSELDTKFSTLSYPEDQCFIPCLCLDGNHQGDTIARKTDQDESLHTHNFVSMWHGLNMVCHMLPTMTHEFINDDRNPWLEPSNGLYFA